MLAMSMMAERVSQEDAALVANHFMNAAVTSTANGMKKAPAKKMVLKSAATTTDAQYYIYENANGEGWVMIAANDVAHPVLAYSETGSFRTEGQPTNLRGWLNHYDQQIVRAEQDGLTANAEVQQEWKALRAGTNLRAATVVVAPLIKTGWDQDAPYWNMCPKNCYTGCVATAMAQVMNYHQWPKQGTGSHSIKYNRTTYSANFGATTYDWANMLDSYAGSATTDQKAAVATLMYHCGVAVDMQYGTASAGGSAAYTIDFNGYFSGRNTMCAETALTKFFGYNAETIKGYYRNGDSDMGMRSWTESEWIAMLKAELDAKRPIMYAGGDKKGESGHSFICDGYDSSNMFHFNWGWSNDCDGYFNINSLIPDEQTGAGGGNYDFSYDQDVIIGIMPPALGPDVNVVWMADGEEFATTVAQNGFLSLPTTTPEACESGKIFMGWTSEQGYEGETAPTYVKAGVTLTGDTTFYAVYATKEEEGGGASVEESLTFSTLGKDNGSSVDGEKIVIGTNSSVTFNKANASNEPKYYDTGKAIRVYGGGNCVVTSTTGNISQIVFTFDSGEGSNTITANTGTFSNDTWTGNAASVTFSVGGTSGHRRVVKIEVTIGGGKTITYSDFTTSCGAPAEKYAITITPATNGSLATSPMTEAAAGRKVTVTATPATYYQLATLNVKDAENADVAVSGQGNLRTFIMPAKAVTISATFAEQQKVTVRFFDQGEQIASAQYYLGEVAEQPATPTTECEHYTFAGWWTTELAADNQQAQTWINDFTVTDAQDYYAIYRKTVITGESQAVAFDGQTPGNYKIYAKVGNKNYYATDFENAKLTSSTDEAEATVFTFEKVNGGFAIKTDDGYIGYTAPKNNKTNIVLASDPYAWSFETGVEGTWRVSSQTNGRALIFREGSYCVFGAYATNNVTEDSEYYDLEILGGGEQTATYYSSVIDCSQTGIEILTTKDQLPTTKILRNGQIFILRGEKVYTLTGQLVK